MPHVITCVCAYWRNIATGCPLLWSSICGDLRFFHQSRDLVLLWLGRAKNAAISLTLTRPAGTRRMGVSLERLDGCVYDLGYLQNFCALFGRLEVDIPSQQPWTSLLERCGVSLAHVTFPALETLAVYSEPIILDHAPNLRHLQSAAEWPINGSSRLQTLCMSAPLKAIATIGEVLASIPGLTRLDVRMAGSSQPLRLRAQHDTLTHLGLHADGPGIVSACLDSFTLPALTSLALGGQIAARSRNQTSQVLRDLIERSSCTISAYSQSSSEEIDAYLDALPGLESLELDAGLSQHVSGIKKLVDILRCDELLPKLEQMRVKMEVFRPAPEGVWDVRDDVGCVVDYTQLCSVLDMRSKTTRLRTFHLSLQMIDGSASETARQPWSHHRIEAELPSPRERR